MSASIDIFKEIRQHLHQHPQLSGAEDFTAQYIETILQKYNANSLIKNLGGSGLAAIYKSKKPGSCLCFRAELDALPIPEVNSLAYQSAYPGISHACGHDGHMAVLIALAAWLDENPSAWSGSVILLFQAAEETGEGALAVLKDPRFAELKPDFIFGMHNLPGFPLNSIILRENIFAAASCGLRVTLEGKTSHAAHPESGISPLNAIRDILALLSQGFSASLHDSEDTMCTIVHLCLGEKAFGTAPALAELMATFRALSDKSLAKTMQSVENSVAQIATAHKVKHQLSWEERFALTENNAEAYRILEEATQLFADQIIKAEAPFLWSEDFSYYGSKYKTAFWGIGAGENHPQLHNPDYDFPDAILETALKVNIQIIKQLENMA